MMSTAVADEQVDVCRLLLRVYSCRCVACVIHWREDGVFVNKGPEPLLLHLPNNDNTAHVL